MPRPSRASGDSCAAMDRSNASRASVHAPLARASRPACRSAVAVDIGVPGIIRRAAIQPRSPRRAPRLYSRTSRPDMTLTSLTQLSAVVIAVTCAGYPVPQELPPPAVVDLGHPLSDTDPTWSGHPVFKHSTSTRNGILVGSFESDEHFGTHVDAPAHFVPGGWTVDQIPVIRFVRPAVRIDIRPQVLKNEDYRMTREDLLTFERKSGAIAPGTIVLIMTGWDTRWRDPARYRNEHDGALHFPGLSVEAAQLLVQ